MKIGLWSDAVNFPSLPLMKISAYHKARGDDITLVGDLHTQEHEYFDIAYCSKTFNLPLIKKIPQLDLLPLADKVYYGGTGFAIQTIDGKEQYDKNNDEPLPAEIEHCYPDYELYPELTKDNAYGFLTRGCPNACPFCVVSKKEGTRNIQVAELSEFWNAQRHINLMDANILASSKREKLINSLIDSDAWINFQQGLDARFVDSDVAELLCKCKITATHFAFDLMKNEQAILKGLELFRKVYTGSNRALRVYILTNYNTTFAEDWYRVKRVMELGYRPDIRIYQKGTHNRFLIDLARWSNSAQIFRSCSFKEYVPRRDGIRCGVLYRDILEQQG